LEQGLVIKSTGSWFVVKSDNGDIVNCKIKGKFRTKGIRATNPLAVGDRVEFDITDDKNTGLIKKLFPRKNYLIRRSSNLSREYQLIASNIDNAWLIASLVSPATFPEFIDRFLITTEAYRIPASIIFNKIDLHNDDLNNYMNELSDVYESIGYRCFAVSALQETNIETLRQEFAGKINVIAGNSGVGKSSLINSMDASLNLKTAFISEYHQQGKHTTTFPEMHELSNGAYVIDTPGIRGFGVVDMDRSELYHFFPEIFQAARSCRFKNCLHTHEPGCAVKEAVEKGQIYYSRYASYISLMQDDNEKYR
jgi:ribosome biogenesis GTPase / thiamine phosphate phosphatase